MRGLGISVYPNSNNIEQIISYIETASKYGFTRIFTCLISAEGSIEEIVAQFKRVVDAANANGMNVVSDVGPDVFEKLQLKPEQLEFFKDLGLWGIRLDLGFSGMEESFMTYHPSGLKIELNMSNGTKYVDNILSYQANKSNLIGCHNFYPHRFTGLSREHFLKCSEQFKALGLRTAAFVSSHTADHGPWPVNEGLCTLEEHRDLPIEVQAKDLFNTGLIDDVIIGNAFASEEELKRLGALNRDLLELQVELVEGLDEIERKIILEEPHFNRGDVSAYMIRSTQSRVKYKGHFFRPLGSADIKLGDILIESALYERYAGELQIAKKPMPNTGKTNIVAKVIESECYLLETIAPWQKFKFVESEK
jgi:hypothetical protein